MNFKPTLLKSIISLILLIVLLILSYIFLGQWVEFIGPNGFSSKYIFEPIKLLPSFVVAIIIYVVWSLV